MPKLLQLIASLAMALNYVQAAEQTASSAPAAATIQQWDIFELTLSGPSYGNSNGKS